MEAMTVMGMAASQARFLGLTARKSNVEYQGQQINQQRSALATESSNLYNQLMTLDVPTPPVTNQFKSYQYTFVDGETTYELGANAIYKRNDGSYYVGLSYTDTSIVKSNNDFRISSVRSVKENEAEGTGKTGGLTYTIKFSGSDNITYNTDDDTCDTASVEPNKIYKLDPDTANQLTGYTECSADGSTYSYFFQDKGGRNYFMTDDELQQLISPDTYPQTKFSFDCIKNSEKTSTVQLVADLTKSSSTGRYTEITIQENDILPNLSGVSFSIDCQEISDQDAYDDAYNDYQYQMAVYNQTVEEINSKTKILQNEDKQLEMRLQQLDTEQNSIATEMESVTKVMDDNIEKTFDAFA